MIPVSYIVSSTGLAEAAQRYASDSASSYSCSREVLPLSPTNISSSILTLLQNDKGTNKKEMRLGEEDKSLDPSL